ncbi:MAG: PD40 domain-containing protein [Thermoleophilaceae bacterium]|nr:PD40 domain-containing protein [Thermoleophilaceae bacterium]
MPEAAATRDRRGVWFALLVAVCAVVAAASVSISALHGAGGAPQAHDGPAGRRAQTPPPGALVFRTLDRVHEGRYGRIAWAPAGGGRPVVGGPACERTYYAAGRGLCLSRAGAVGASVRVRFLDEGLAPWRELTLPGIPSRARISPDGRLGAVTAFVTGHSYADPGTFSTRTTILDMTRGRRLADLEDFEVTRDGEPFRSIDFNFWGVTFAEDGNTFYATLASGGDTYLVRGDLRGRRLETVRRNAECPSLSPDGTRLVYKKLVGSPPAWRYHVLEPATGIETPLPEKRAVDDQAEWLDDGHVLYRVEEDIWESPVTGGRPRLYRRSADSPALLRDN